MAVLIGMSSSVKGKKFEVTHDETHIGRNALNHFPVDDASVSGRHCSILRNERRFTLVDLGSTNGTRLNGASISKVNLRPKDIIQVGNIELMFDGQDVDVDPNLASETAKIEVMDEPVQVPKSFHTASPFGARRDSRKPWVILTIALIALVLGSLGFFIFWMFSA